MEAVDTMDVEAMPRTTEQAGEDPVTGPLRRCIVSREVLPKEMLVRFVIGPAGEIVPDVEGKLPGRGLWVRADSSTLDTAVAKALFAKAARRPVEVPADLVARTAALLARRCLDLIGLARRAGQAICGFERVRAALQHEGVGVLLTARDGAAGGQHKLRALAGELPGMTLFTSADLSAVFGRENVVHAALTPGRFAELLIAESARFAGMRRTCEENDR